MISWILILIISLFIPSVGCTTDGYDPSYFKKEYLGYDRSHNQITRRGIPVQLAPPLETELRRYKSEKIRIYMEDSYAKGQRHVKDDVMDAFVSSTVVDWLYENLKEVTEELTERPDYRRLVDTTSFKIEFDTEPFVLVQDKKTYKWINTEQITLREKDNTFVVSIPRNERPERQLAYCEGGVLTSYTDIQIQNGLRRLMVPRCARSTLSSRVTFPIHLEKDVIFLGDWVITSTDLLPRYEYSDTPLPDPSLVHYIPKPLKERLLSGLFETFKMQMNPVIQLRTTIKTLWDEAYPSTTRPKTLEAMQAADADRRLLRKIFSHPTLTRDIGFKGTSKRLEKLTWDDLHTKCETISNLTLACKISDISEITSWQDIFSIGASIGVATAATEVIKSLQADAEPSAS